MRRYARVSREVVCLRQTHPRSSDLNLLCGAACPFAQYAHPEISAILRADAESDGYPIAPPARALGAEGKAPGNNFSKAGSAAGVAKWEN